MSKSHLLVILQAENRASVACEDSLVLLQGLERIFSMIKSLVILQRLKMSHK